MATLVPYNEGTQDVKEAKASSSSELLVCEWDKGGKKKEGKKPLWFNGLI